MFHVLLALPVLPAFGAMAVVVLSVVLAIWGAAFAIELALGLLCRRNRWCLWIPAVVGAVGMLLMLLARMYPLELPFILLFWGGYALALLCGWAVSAGIARLIRTWKQSTESKPK